MEFTMNAVISDIKRFAVHDGPGIRTTVFFKGCPLNCVWCHNPESISLHPQTAYYREKCISCGICAEVCPEKAHIFTAEGHIFDRSRCRACGICEETCFGQSLKHYGKEMTVEELLDILLEDKAFYDQSGGGITLSGGECLVQPAVCTELLKQCKEKGLHTAVDTCGFVPQNIFERILPYTDLFLYDLKAIDEEIHIQCTGRSNQLILENLRYLVQKHCRIEIRIPYVPGWNDKQLPSIISFLRELDPLPDVKLLPYHPFSDSKHDALGSQNNFSAQAPSACEVQTAEQLLSSLRIRT